MKYAVRGFKQLWKSEQNFRLQVVAGFVVLLAAWYFPFEAWERVTLILLVTMVLILEAVNSVFERLVDVLKSRVHPSVRDMKDIMAAAVLIASIVSLVIGVMLFYPVILETLSST